MEISNGYILMIIFLSIPGGIICIKLIWLPQSNHFISLKNHGIRFVLLVIMSSLEKFPIEIDKDLIVRNLNPSPIIPKCSVAEYLSQKMQEWSEESLVGLENGHTGEKMTYADWYEKSKCFTSSLIDFSVNKDDLVLLFGPNTIEMAVAMMGVIWMGLTFSPVTTANGQYELTQQIKDSRSTVLIIDREKLTILRSAIDNDQYGPVILANLRFLIVLNCSEDDELFVRFKDKVQESISVFIFKQMLEKGSNKDFPIPFLSIEPDDQFMIVYTSGTTGLPKGAIYSNRSTLALLATNQEKSMKGTKFLQWYPLGHISGSCFTMICIQNGQQIVLFSKVNLEEVLEYVQKHHILRLPVSPDQIVKLASNDYNLKYDLTSLKFIMTGGSKVSKDHIKTIEQKYQVIFLDFFGATELMTPTRMDFHDRVIGSVGKPGSGMQIKIVDLKTGLNLPANQLGEVCARGPQRFVGYLRNEQATKAAIDEDGWYHYGDVGYYDQSGSLFIADRIKELIKFREWSVFPSEIEDFLQKHDAIQHACVIGVKHIQDGSLVRAYVQLKDGCQATENDIIKYVQDNMGFQKRLRGGVRFVENMPRTSVGKIDRKYFHNLVKDEILTEMVE